MSLTTSETLTWVGRDLGATTFLVTRTDLLKYSYATQQTNPVYLSAEAAQKAGHRDIIAPFDFYIALRNMAAALAPLDEFLEDGTLGGDMPPMNGAGRARAGEVKAEFFGRIVAGDTIEVNRRIGNISEKEGRSGPLAFVEYVTSLTRDDELQLVLESYTRIVTS